MKKQRSKAPGVKGSKKPAAGQGLNPRRREHRRKVLKYALLRGIGVRSVNAVRRAGFKCRTRKKARAVACVLNRELRDQNALDAALEEAGVCQETIAGVMAKALRSRKVHVALDAAKLTCKVLGYDQPQRSDQVHVSIPYEERQRLRLEIGQVLAEEQTPGDAGSAG